LGVGFSGSGSAEIRSFLACPLKRVEFPTNRVGYWSTNTGGVPTD
jgi:hypothetical protein